MKINKQNIIYGAVGFVLLASLAGNSIQYYKMDKIDDELSYIKLENIRISVEKIQSEQDSAIIKNKYDLLSNENVLLAENLEAEKTKEPEIIVKQVPIVQQKTLEERKREAKETYRKECTMEIEKSYNELEETINNACKNMNLEQMKNCVNTFYEAYGLSSDINTDIINCIDKKINIYGY